MLESLILAAALGAPCDCPCHDVSRPVLRAVVSLPARAVAVPVRVAAVPPRLVSGVVRARPARRAVGIVVPGVRARR